MTSIRRRHFLTGGISLMAAATIPASGLRATDFTKIVMPAAPRAGDPLHGDTLFADVVRYDGLGPHRTGTEGDAKTAAWLAEELSKAGYKVERQRFEFSHFFNPRRSDLTFSGGHVAGFPYWPVVQPKNGSVTAKLARLPSFHSAEDVAGKIALANFAFRAGELTSDEAYASQIRRAHQAGALAVVAVTENPTGEITAVNNPWDTPPWPLPVLQVGQKDEKTLQAVIESDKDVTFAIEGDYREKANADNIVGRLARGPKWVVVSTPMSGWFSCAGERGTGLAIWLGLARWAATRRSETSFVFVTTSGHELNYLGAHSFLHAGKDGPPAPAQTRLWFHIGANIATHDWLVHSLGRLWPLPGVRSERLLFGTPDMMGILRAAFQGQPGLELPRVGTKETTIGETQNVLKADYTRVAGISGGSVFHHTPADHPFVTAPELLAPVARSLSYILENEAA